MWNLVLQSWKKLHYHNVFGNQTWQGDDLPSMGRTHKVIWHFNDVVFSDHVSNWNRYTSCPTMHMSTTFGRILSFLEGILPIKSYYPSIAWSSCMTHYFHYISISTEQSMVTRYDKEITTHCKEIQLVKLHGTLIWWSCEITRKMKNVKSPLIRPMDTKLGKIMTYYERLPFLKSHYPLITWPTWGNVTNWKVISPFSQDLLSLSLAGWLLQGGGSEHKRQNRQLFVYF